MERRFIKMEERMKKITLDQENLQLENEALRRKSVENAILSHVERNEAKLQSTTKTKLNDKEEKKMHQALHHLMEKYEEMSRKIGTSFSVDTILNNTNLPYSREIMVVPLPLKLKVLKMELYDESKDPVKHLETFKVHMNLHGSFEEIACKAFSLNLKGIARGWFGPLYLASIDSFEEIIKQFLTQFMTSKWRR